MLNGHLVEEVGRDQEAIALIKSSAEQPHFLAVMRSLVERTYTEFEEKCRALLALSNDEYLLGLMASLLQEVDRAAAASRAERRPNGLLRAVLVALSNYGTERTFTTRDLVCAVEKRGFSFVGQSPRQSVYHALRALEKAGRVEVVIRGHGRLMNTYRAIEGPQTVLYHEEVLHAG